MKLSLALRRGYFAQSNVQNKKETQIQLKHEEKVDKAQAEADKVQRKAQGTPQNRAYARAYHRMNACPCRLIVFAVFMRRARLRNTPQKASFRFPELSQAA